MEEHCVFHVTEQQILMEVEVEEKRGVDKYLFIDIDLYGMIFTCPVRDRDCGDSSLSEINDIS